MQPVSDDLGAHNYPAGRREDKQIACLSRQPNICLIQFSPRKSGIRACSNHPFPHLVENVVVALWIVHRDHAGPLEEIRPDGGSRDDPLGIEVDLDILSKAGRIVVPDCLGIAKCFKERVRLQHLSSRQAISSLR